jgi:hypothetical protein
LEAPRRRGQDGGSGVVRGSSEHGRQRRSAEERPASTRENDRDGVRGRDKVEEKSLLTLNLEV